MPVPIATALRQHGEGVAVILAKGPFSDFDATLLGWCLWVDGPAYATPTLWHGTMPTYAEKVNRFNAGLPKVRGGVRAMVRLFGRDTEVVLPASLPFSAVVGK
jgi:hypothetical protein